MTLDGIGVKSAFTINVGTDITETLIFAKEHCQYPNSCRFKQCPFIIGLYVGTSMRPT